MPPRARMHRPRRPDVTLRPPMHIGVEPRVHVQHMDPRMSQHGQPHGVHVPIDIDLRVHGQGKAIQAGGEEKLGEGKKEGSEKPPWMTRPYGKDELVYDPKLPHVKMAYLEAAGHDIRSVFGKEVSERELAAMEKIALPSGLEPWVYSHPKFRDHVKKLLLDDFHREAERAEESLKRYEAWVEGIRGEISRQSTWRTFFFPLNRTGPVRYLLAPFVAAFNTLRMVTRPISTVKSTKTYKRYLLARAEKGIGWEQERIHKLVRLTHEAQNNVMQIYKQFKSRQKKSANRILFWETLHAAQESYFKERNELRKQQNPHIVGYISDQTGPEFGPKKTRWGVSGHVETDTKGRPPSNATARQLFNTPGSE